MKPIIKGYEIRLYEVESQDWDFVEKEIAKFEKAIENVSGVQETFEHDDPYNQYDIDGEDD